MPHCYQVALCVGRGIPATWAPPLPSLAADNTSPLPEMPAISPVKIEGRGRSRVPLPAANVIISSDGEVICKSPRCRSWRSIRGDQGNKTLNLASDLPGIGPLEARLFAAAGTKQGSCAAVRRVLIRIERGQIQRFGSNVAIWNRIEGITQPRANDFI